jgi:hypothetical protein
MLQWKQRPPASNERQRMKDLKSASLIVVIAAASGALAFVAATASAGRRAALLETKVAALEARLDAEAAAKQKTIAEALHLDISNPKSPYLFLINR